MSKKSSGHASDAVARLWGKLAKIFPFLLCFSIVGLCTWGMWKHYTKYAGRQDIINTLETKLLDFRFSMRGPEKPTGKVGVLAIDEKTIQRLGRWPLPRSMYEPAFKNLKKLGVSWIGFDVVFSEPERPLLDDVTPSLKKLKALPSVKKDQWPQYITSEINHIQDMIEVSPGDVILASSIKAYQNIVMGYFFPTSEEEAKVLGKNPFRALGPMLSSEITTVILPEGRTLAKNYPDLRGTGVVGNTEYLSKATSNFAFFNNQPDSDAIVRWAELVKVLDGKLMPALSLKTAASALGREIVAFFDDIGVEEIGLMNPEKDTDLIKIPTDPEGAGRILINHRGPDRTFTHFSFADAYDNTFSEKEQKALKGKTLLLGPTAIGINDQRANPFDSIINGVENHAAVVDNIFKGDFMRRPKNIYLTELLIILGIGILFSPVMIYSRAALSGIAAILFLVGYYYFDKYYWFRNGVWAYLGMPFIEITTLFISVTLYKYMTEEREKKKVRGAFSHYLSPDVIAQVLEHPENLKLGGDKKELTVFFSDVRSFTTISESLTPEKLSELMNEYFTPMTGIILRSGGVLDKYIGDAIMAFWGAPLDLPDHADRAALSALMMLLELDKLKVEFNKRGLPKIDIGIGLNTGPMSVGNMGSNDRFQYTVMGDAVNLGSRLEGITKEYGVKAIMSEFTQAKIKNPQILCRDLDDVRVKGKLEPVKLFELVRPDLLKSESAIKDLIGEFTDGRKAYRAQDWPKAKEHFLKCMQIKPDDGPTALYLKDIEKLESQPKIENWDGVRIFTHK